MSDLSLELNAVARTIRNVLTEDDFPARIRPPELRDAVLSYPLRGGKRLRPALLLWACSMFGGDRASALSAAAAVEVYHNWTLVHDDIIDCDDTRRGLPATHMEIAQYAETVLHAPNARARKFGSDLAILAGDLQQAWAFHLLARTAERGAKPDLILRLAQMMQTQLACGLISGEALDVEFELRDPTDVEIEDVFRMIDGKTGAIFRFALHCGAALALGRCEPDEEPFASLSDYALNLARAFQLQDDMLGVFGSEEEFGKPLCSDFQEAKPTVLFLEAWSRMQPAQKAALGAMLRKPDYRADDVRRIRALLADCGAADAVRERIYELSETARGALSSLPDSPERDLLRDLIGWLMERSV